MTLLSYLLIPLDKLIMHLRLQETLIFLLFALYSLHFNYLIFLLVFLFHQRINSQDEGGEFIPSKAFSLP